MELLTQKERMKMLEAQKDIEAMEAEYKVYAEESEWNAKIENNGEIFTQPQGHLPEQHTSAPCIKVPQIPSFFPRTAIKQETGTNDVTLAQVLKETLATTRLPAPEPFVFKGDPLKFIEWSNCFKALIESSCSDPAHRLYYLKKYIEGEALCVPDGTFYRSDEEAYTQTWEALNKRYGYSFIVQRAFQGKLSS